ncbi:MAG TPA: coenzyme F420-0:L-glutamate ligase [Vicinamibacterales bacterium]|nr:coenzyme F420-0:L-glutamate ligase [Vicinamibacterales bacterium]
MNIRVVGLPGVPEVQAGDDLVSLTVGAVERAALTVEPGDVFVYAQKIVSKAEDRLVRLDSVVPSALAHEWGRTSGRDPRVIELVIQDARRVVRMDRGVLIVETAHGFICANAGIDTSNIRPGWAARLPADPDATARRICAGLRSAWRLSVGVIVADTFGRPWREGQMNVAIGAAGLRSVLDYRGRLDSHGQTLRSTAIAVADELAAAGELVMGKAGGIPIALIQGAGAGDCGVDEGSVRTSLLRRPEEDLFR